MSALASEQTFLFLYNRNKSPVMADPLSLVMGPVMAEVSRLPPDFRLFYSFSHHTLLYLLNFC